MPCADYFGGQAESDVGPFLPRDAMQVRPMSSCGICLSVCPSMCLSRSYILSQRINIYSIFFTIWQPHHFGFSISNGIAIFRREPPPPKEGVECRWGRQKSRFWANIWLQCVLLTLLPARCYTTSSDYRPASCDTSLVVSVSVCWWRKRTANVYDKKFQRYVKDNITAFNCTQW